MNDTSTHAVLGVPVANPVTSSDPEPSAPPAPPAPSLESQLAQCARCQRLGWREEMVRDEATGQYACRGGCVLLQIAPRRRWRCCTIS